MKLVVLNHVYGWYNCVVFVTENSGLVRILDFVVENALIHLSLPLHLISHFSNICQSNNITS